VVRVDSTNTYWWSIGDDKGDSRPVEKKEVFDSLLLHNYNNKFLSTLVKIHPKADFSTYVRILDHFGRVEDSLKADREFLEDYLTENRDVLGESKFTDTTFSYRYTTTPWNERKDNRMLEFALDSMRARGERMRP